MPTIPQMIRTGRGEFSSSSLLRDGVAASGDIMFSNDRLAAADRIDGLVGEVERLRNLIKTGYIEGIIDVGSRGATVDTWGDFWETSDVAQCVMDPSAEVELLGHSKEGRNDG